MDTSGAACRCPTFWLRRGTADVVGTVGATGWFKNTVVMVDDVCGAGWRDALRGWRGMQVPRVEQQSDGVTVSVPAGAAARLGGDDAGAVAHPTAGTDVTQDGVAFARVAIFDLKGDGHIDPRSVLDGGDATLLVPEYPLYLSTDARVVPSGGTSGAAAKTSSGEIIADVVGGPAGSVRADQAIAAYRSVADGTAPALASNIDAATRRV